MKTIIPFSLSAQAARAACGILARGRDATTMQVKRARVLDRCRIDTRRRGVAKTGVDHATIGRSHESQQQNNQ
jgi:hypothetical protein